MGNASVAVLPGGAQATIVGLAQQQSYFVYYQDPNFTGGAITPIATQNSGDFLNKPGYFLIDSITTPYAAASSGTGSGAGTTSGSRFSPSSYSDMGSRTTSNPANAYDGDSTTAAVVGANALYTPGPVTNSTGAAQPNAQPIGGGSGTYRITNGSILYEGFASFVTTAAVNLNVLAAFTTSGGIVTVTASINGTSSTLTQLTATTASATYTLAIPVGTNLSTVTVQIDVNANANGTSSTNASFSAYEIFIQ